VHCGCFSEGPDACVRESRLVSTPVHFFGQCALTQVFRPLHPTSNVSTIRGNHLGADDAVSIPEQVPVHDLCRPCIQGDPFDSMANTTCAALSRVAAAINFPGLLGHRNFAPFELQSSGLPYTCSVCPVTSSFPSCEHASDIPHNVHASVSPKHRSDHTASNKTLYLINTAQTNKTVTFHFVLYTQHA
jgi:hypothetical protein